MDLIGCGVDIGMSVEVGGVCLLRRGGVMGSVECVDESWRMRLFMNVSSAPVSRYFRWDLESSSACFWVCVRVGMRPWYMVARLMRSMCIPHVHPSFCLGVLCMWVFGAFSRRRGGAIADSLYHWRRVVWILLIACGGCRLRGS